MDIFREVRDAIRRLPEDCCFGITNCVMVPKDKGAMYMHRDVFFAKKRGAYKGKEYQRIQYPITNWRKRLAILTEMQRKN